LLPSVTDALIARSVQEITRERETPLTTEPYAAARQKAWAALFSPAHPLGRVLATPSPQRMNVAAVKQTLRRSFAPSSATLVLVGDFDTAAVLPRLQRYFGDLPSRPRPQAPPIPKAALRREVVIRHDESIGRLPLLEVSYLVPPWLSDGSVAASLLARILSRGHEGRLDRLLVTEQRLAVRVESDVRLMRGQSVLTLSVFAEQAPQLGRSLAVIDQVLADLAEHGVTAEELLAVQRRHRNETILSLHPIEAKAHWLQTAANAGAPDLGIERELALLDKVRSEDLQALVRTSCQPNQRVLLFATPAVQTQIIQR
jgi:predicted Zn-dependent peptidase